MPDDNVKPTEQNPQVVDPKPPSRPRPDPDLSDHYQRDPSPDAIEKR